MASTRAQETLLAALNRTYRSRRGRTALYRRLWALFDPDETVRAVADGSPYYLNTRLMILTDRRIVLVRQKLSQTRWRVLRHAPMAMVQGGSYASTPLTSESLEIKVFGRKPISMRVGNPDAAADFLAALGPGGQRRVDSGGTSVRAEPECYAPELLADGERVYSVFEGFSKWTSEQRQLLLTDRRVLLIGRQTPGKWVVRRSVPAAEVTGAKMRGGTRLKVPSVEVDSRTQKPIVLIKGTAQAAREFVRTLTELLGGR